MRSFDMLADDSATSVASEMSVSPTADATTLPVLLCLPDEIISNVLNHIGVGDLMRLQSAVVKQANRRALSNATSRSALQSNPGYLWDGNSLRGLAASGIKLSSMTFHPSVTDTDLVSVTELLSHVHHATFYKCSGLNIEILRYCPNILSLSVCIKQAPPTETMLELAASASKLQSLRLICVGKGVGNGAITAVAQIFPLEHLDLSCAAAGLVNVDIWAPHCTRLKSVSFNNGFSDSAHSVQLLCRTCTCLEALHMESSRQGPHRSVVPSILPLCTQLTTLHLSIVDSLSAESLRAIAQYLPDLTDLSISDFSHNARPALPWAMLFSTCTKLRKFTLLGHNLPDFIESLLQCELPLTYLRIPRCRSEEGLYCIAQQFSSLLTLEVSGPAVTDLVLAGIAGGCPLLESLNVACSEQFSVDAFVTLTRACRKLRIVNLRQCRQINDYAVSSLAENCRGLERVDLCGLSLLTDSSMETLGQKSRQLRYLDVSLCSQVTVVGVDAVLWGCKKLAVLEVRGCTRAAQVLAFRAMQNTRWSCDEEWH